MANYSRFTRTVALVSTLAVVGAVAVPAVAQAGTALISKSSSGAKGNLASSEPSLSGTGRFIAFDSDARNLVDGDTNGVTDCFVRDQASGITERVSVSSTGEQSNGSCWGPAISQDGQWVAFAAAATNLGGSTNGEWQIYLHNRSTGVTRLVSKRVNGGQGGNKESIDASISKDGRWVAYESAATNLIANDGNGVRDVFLYDRTTGENKRISVSSGGKAGNGGSTDPAVSADGRFVAYTSYAKNLVKGDTNGKRDVFVYNRLKNKTERASVRTGGKQANGASWNGTISGNGRFVAFESKARNLAKADTSRNRDVFVYDRWKKRVQQVSKTSGGKQAKGESGDPTISNNGRWIAFESTAANLAKGDTNKKRDSFVRDRTKGKTRIVSKRSNGKIAWGDQDDPFISGDGKYVVFESTAKKIVPADQDKLEDIFRRGALY